ncbi:pectinesterase family protein [Sphingobacterium spiritivorum]|uniref:pectinesterase family protein n=1 Tax=Sphingobacterium spiritivorum TaxID=258 RepID=UPI003DA28AD9
MKIKITIWFLLLYTTVFAQQPLKLTVAQQGTADFRTIQEAVYAVRDHFEQPVQIFVRNGVYREKLIIPAWKRYIHIVGESKEETIIQYDDFSGKDNPDKTKGLDKINTYLSYTVLVQGNDTRLENLTIENTAGPVGQAVALHLEADRVAVKNCNVSGWQDTFYLAKDGTRNYVEDCYISGSTDFIFGAATAFFKNCVIESRSNSYITAASTTQQSTFGFIFQDCKLITKDKAVTKVYLGRPWRPYAKTVFIRCELGEHITAKGWDSWNGDKMFPDKYKTATYIEMANYGAGAADLSGRVAWSRQWRKYNNKDYALQKVFGDWDPLKNQ